MITRHKVYFSGRFEVYSCMTALQALATRSDGPSRYTALDLCRIPKVPTQA
jgi:hypothetical protein